MKCKANETTRKLRGGYYTPEPVARFLARWALAGGARRLLEPSCGDGSFLQAIGAESGASSDSAGLAVDAVEIAAEEADRARERSPGLQRLGVSVTIHNADFFHWIANGAAEAQWDAILGNPPYIRYQYFDTTQRDTAQRLFALAGVPFTKRTNAWVPFLIAGVLHLAPGGRLAMVIPEEILHILHAEGLRRLLEREMESVTLLSIRDMVFENAQQGVALLLAVKRAASPPSPVSVAPETRLEIIDIDSVEHLDGATWQISPRPVRASPPSGDWMQALLTDDERERIQRITALPAVKRFVEIADVDIGIVTGANGFFVVNAETAERYGLKPISSPMLAKSDLIDGISYALADHEANAARGRPVYFLQFPPKPLSELPPAMADYLRTGAAQQLPERYKCRIREPWYVVPYVWTAELALLKRCHLHPKIVLNTARAHSTDTAYRIKMRAGYTDRAQDLTFSFLNSLTFLFAEMLGRRYGGGVLELVPSEIERLLIPLQPVHDEDFRHADALIRNGSSLDSLTEFTDKKILQEGVGLSTEDIALLRAAHRRLMNRRLRRASA